VIEIFRGAADRLISGAVAVCSGLLDAAGSRSGNGLGSNLVISLALRCL